MDRVGVAIFHVSEAHRRTWARAIHAEPKLLLLETFGSMGSAKAWLSTATPDLIITDAQFPDGCGFEFIQEIQAHHSSCITIVVSDSGDESTVFRCIEAGAAGYFLNEQTRTNIAKAILDFYSGGSPVSPEIARMMMNRARLQARALRVKRPSASADLLTKRESTILELMARGNSDKTIGQTLSISYLTAQTHVKNIYRKLKASSRTEAIFKARALGLGE